MSVKMLDITDQVDFSSPDDESLPITTCVCGARFRHWDFTIGIYSDEPKQCPSCKREFFFVNQVRIFQVVDEGLAWKISKI